MAFVRLQLGALYQYGWARMGRKGELCTLLIVARKMNSVLIQFQDGYKAVTSSNALRLPGKNPPQPKFDFGQ